MFHFNRLKTPNAKSLSALLAEDEQVMEHVHELVGRLHRRERHLAEHSMATALLAASIARSMDLDIAEVFAAGVVGALHEVASLVVEAPTEAESLMMTESLWMLAKSRFRIATLDILSEIAILRPYADPVAQLYTDTLTSPISRIVLVADLYDWFVSDGEGNRSPYSSRDALLYLERNAGVRFQRDVVAALRDLCSGASRADDDLELA